MKKTYKKPYIVMENFNFSQSIASGCSQELLIPGYLNQGNDGSCGYDVNGIVYFNTDTMTGVCKMDMPMYCYNAPEGGNSVFSVS